jgi:hypothetical protein
MPSDANMITRCAFGTARAETFAFFAGFKDGFCAIAGAELTRSGMRAMSAAVAAGTKRRERIEKPLPL